MTWLPLALVFLGAPAVEPAELTTYASASPRPESCRRSVDGEGSELWARARGGVTDSYCAALAFGYARLRKSPEAALELSRKAAALLPAPAEPRVLAGRALVRLGQWDAAYPLLLANVTAKGRPLGDVAALRELGVAAMATGHLNEAVAAYRALVPRVGFTKDPLFTRLAVLEAAATLMALGPSGLADATRYLSDARRTGPVPGLDDLTTALLALSLDRAAKSDQADVVVRELEGAWALERFVSEAGRARLAGTTSGAAAGAPLVFRERQPLLVEDELLAAIGVVAARSDTQLARAALQAYLAGATSTRPFHDWAKAKLAALGRAPTAPSQ